MNDFNIQAASLISGVTVHQIRAWERRYNAVRPKRLGNNFRSYTQENISRLKLLGILTRHGIAISKIAPLETFELQGQYDLLVANEKPRTDVSHYKENKEKLGFLMMFLSAKKIEILKHEVTKFETLSSVTEILIPIIKRLMSDSAFKEQEYKDLLNTLIDQINRISNQASNNSVVVL